MYDTPDGTRRLSSRTMPPRRRDDVDAGDVRVDPARHVHSLHLAPELRVAQDTLARHHAGVEDRLVVIDVMQERIERLYALPQAAVEHLPFRRRNDPRHDVERDQPLGSAVLAIDGERDAHAMKCALRFFAFLRDATRGGPVQPAGESLVMRPHATAREPHFIIGCTGHEGFPIGTVQAQNPRQVLRQAGNVPLRQQLTRFIPVELAGDSPLRGAIRT
jgi:hypothetical protein